MAPARRPNDGGDGGNGVDGRLSQANGKRVLLNAGAGAGRALPRTAVGVVASLGVFWRAALEL